MANNQRRLPSFQHTCINKLCSESFNRQLTRKRGNFWKRHFVSTISASRYCQTTSLHGFKYLDTEEGRVRKLIWVGVIIAVICLSIWVLNENLQQYMDATTRTSIESTTSSLSEIIFPAVYICNVNQVQWDTFVMLIRYSGIHL